MFPGTLQNICDAYKNPLQMSGFVKLHVLLDSTHATFRFNACKTLAPLAIIGTDLSDQYVSDIRSKQMLVKLDNGDCIPNVRKPCVRTMLQSSLPNGLTYVVNSAQPSPFIRVAKKI